MQERSLSPEAEVMRLLSSNLFKRYNTVVQEEDKRLIDANSLISRRIEELDILHNKHLGVGGTAGFTAGLVAEQLETPDEEAFLSGNVIKANEDARIIREQAAVQAETILTKAREEADAIRRAAIEQAQADGEEVIRQASSQGYEEGLQKAAREAETLKQQFMERQRQMEEEYQRLIDEIEPELVDAITGVYEHIFHVELHKYRDILAYLISCAMRKAEGSRNFLIHVSKEDYPYVSMQKKQITAGSISGNTMLEIIEDVTLNRNECLIETDGGIFDCGLGTQLEELGQKLRLLSYENK